MQDRLPPLTALRAFDAAARHMSFALAAAELHVSPAALSFQIKSLETHLGAPLFKRLNRAVELTEAGRALAPAAAEAFQTLATGWRVAHNLHNNQTLTVTAGPAFTAKWLAPRLFDFAQLHPEIELRFAASLRIMDLHRDNIDVAIRFGAGTDDGLYALPLAEEWVTPVMTAELAGRYPTPESLAGATLIVDQSTDFLDPPIDWPAWFHAMGVDVQPNFGPRFSQADHAIDAAVAGVGVTLGRQSLVIKDLADGKLVAPYPHALRMDARFRFLCVKGTETRPQVDAFKNWVLQEIEKTVPMARKMTLIGPPVK